MVTNIFGHASGPSRAPLALVLAGAAVLIKVLAFIIALVSSLSTWSLPWTGLEFDNVGRIHEIATSGPNTHTVKVGDIILEVEGRSLHETKASVYGMRSAGQTIPYTIQRDDTRAVVDIAVVDPPWWVRLERSTLFALALGFIVLGLAIFVRDPWQEEYAIFALMCSLFAIMISTMELASVQVLWAAYINQFAVALSVATFLHFHLLFPAKRRYGYYVAAVAYLTAFGIGSIYAAFEVYQVRLQPWYPVFYGVASIFLLSCFALSAGSLIQAWVVGNGEQRRRLRVVSAGTLLTIATVIFLVIATHLFNLNEAILYKVVVWSLLFIPIGYGIALHRNDLFATDLKIHRVLTYLLLVLALLATHFVIVWMLTQLTSGGYSEVSGSIASLFVAFSFRPLQELVERLVNRLVYGTAYNYLRVLSPAIDHLGRFNYEALNEVLTLRVPTALRVSQASFWMMNLSLMEGSWLGGELARGESLALPTALTKEDLERGQPIVVDRNSETWQAWPFGEVVRWIVPLVVDKELQGVWLMGQRSQDDSFSPMDHELLKTIGQAAALVIKGIGLVGEVDKQLMESQAARAELSQAYQMLTKAGERER
ncbi:MAG: hypothetical protein H0T73_00820, partial [Ardenticatenales bacterium]|nr:hypothetical protein [Ardenticatenales bacterium]